VTIFVGMLIGAVLALTCVLLADGRHGDPEPERDRKADV